MPDPKKKYPIYNILDDPNIVEVPNITDPNEYYSAKVKSVSDHKTVTSEKNGKQNFRALYSSKGKISYDSGDVSYMRKINDINNDKIKYFAVYKFDGPDGVSTTFDKHTDNTQRQILKFGDAAERLAKRKNKKLNRVEKRTNRKMDKM